MPRKFLNEFGEREKVKDVFILGDKQLRQNRNGDLYLQMRLSDKSGACNAMLWNADESVARGIKNGDYVDVDGLSQFYNGTIQIIVNRIEIAEPGNVNEEDFVLVDADRVEECTAELTDMLLSLRDVHLRRLAQSFLDDKEFMEKFTRAPAAIKNHHAFHGGLLEHVVQLMRLARKVSAEYDELDDDLLLMGAFLHDSGKIDELTYARDLGYSDEGQLIGHLVMGVVILDQQIAKLNAELSAEMSDNSESVGRFPEELGLRLKHMIVSHHGKYEFGSPKLPMTLEAVALHYLDDLDAKIHNFRQLMSQDTNVDSPWTPYHANLGRKLYKSAKSTD